jgi:hypothetical protein
MFFVSAGTGIDLAINIVAVNDAKRLPVFLSPGQIRLEDKGKPKNTKQSAQIFRLQEIHLTIEIATPYLTLFTRRKQAGWVQGGSPSEGVKKIEFSAKIKPGPQGWFRKESQGGVHLLFPSRHIPTYKSNSYINPY